MAAFAGFAERGPLNLPVALEDASQYRALFGGDLAVARDEGRPVYAHLPGAVRAFFNNGGRRCYVVRVAGPDARASRFRMPGLLGWSDEAGYCTVVARAASVGRWSERLTLATQLRVRPLPLSTLPPSGQAPLAGVQVIVELPAAIKSTTAASTADVLPGDLLGIGLEGEDRGYLLLPVREVRRVSDAPASSRGASFALASDRARVLAFTRRRPGAGAGSPPMPGSLLGGESPVVLQVERLSESGWVAIDGLDGSPPATPVLGESGGPSGVAGQLSLTLPAGAAVAGGDVLRISCPGETLLFPVDGVGYERGTGSPPGAGLSGLRVTASAPLWEAPDVWASLPENGVLADVRQVDLLRFDLLIVEGSNSGGGAAAGESVGQELWRELRFGQGPGYWEDALTDLPEDAVLAPTPSATGQSNGTGVASTAGTGTVFGARSLRLRAPDATAEETLYLPIGMALLPDPDLVAGPLPEQASGGPLTGLDGLDEFEPGDLFLDQRLRGLSAADLMIEAERLLYQDEPPARLAALHALIGVEEVGIIGLPDLAHRHWGPPLPLDTPKPPPAPAVPPTDWSRFQGCPAPPPPVTLTPEEVVAGFLGALRDEDEAAARDYLALSLLMTLDPTASLLPLLGLERPPVEFEVDPLPCQPVTSQETFVRATLLLVSGAWLDELFRMAWDGVRWEIAGIDPQAATTLASSVLQDLARLPVVKSSKAFRQDPARLSALVEVQDVMVNVAAGRKDLVVILSLPEHFERQDVLTWQAAVLTPGTGFDEVGLSYAAAYHPWSQVREEVTPELGLLRSEPPDGAVCGVIAARELRRGPWIAPAGVPFLGVIGLAPSVGEKDWVSLFNAQINLLHPRPGLFTQMSSHTLSQDPQLIQLSVRRLLIYLRKLVLRRGMEYAFESNTERFRRRVEAGLERTLDGLARQGALAAYQVVTGEGLNTPNDVDNGRFIVALKIAPTTPIEFITVALLRSGEGLLQVVEA